jgi:hypothetical protein
MVKKSQILGIRLVSQILIKNIKIKNPCIDFADAARTTHVTAAEDAVHPAHCLCL